jgi:uncharacterized protein (TIGR03546 family)
MILWICKLISSARRAFAGRRYPHQLAWAVAFGLLLGVIPHGNLLALAVLIVVLSLKINHAMAGLTAVGTTFLATYLDPFSHQVGEFVLTNPNFRETAASAWQLPLVPWTDLNNTVVMGSFLIGSAAILPVFGLTYPIFRMMAPKEGSQPDPGRGHSAAKAADRTDTSSPTTAKAHQLVLVDQGHVTVAPPHRTETTEPTADSEGNTPIPFQEVEPQEQTANKKVAVQTRIDVIRMKDHRSVGSPKASTSHNAADSQPMDEALNYLLRQLRDSQQRKAA